MAIYERSEVILETFLQQIINGIVMGSMYALMASGLSLIWSTMRMINLAHGEFYMLGGFIMFFFNVSFGLHPVIAAIISMIIVFIVAVVFERTIIHYLIRKPEWDVNQMLVTFGISIVLQNLALKLWGERFKNIPYYLNQNISVSGIRLSEQRLLIIVVAVIVIFAFWGFLKFSRFGKALRATSQERDSATLCGINTDIVYMIAYGIGAVLATIAAIMLSPIYSVNPWMGSDPMLKALAVVVIGGLGSLFGAIIGGISLGIIEALGILAISSEWQNVIAFGILILVLWIKPSGLFGVKE